jgi:hypothetical protein
MEPNIGNGSVPLNYTDNSLGSPSTIEATIIDSSSISGPEIPDKISSAADLSELTQGYSFLERQPLEGSTNANNSTLYANNPTLTQPNENGQNQNKLFVDSVKILFVANATEQLMAVIPALTETQIENIIQYMADPSQVELSDGEKAVADQVSPAIMSQVQQQAGLPSQWTINSYSDTWNQVPPAPYKEDEQLQILTAYDNQISETVENYVATHPDLTDSQRSELLSADFTGGAILASSDPKVQAGFDEIKPKVTESIQKTYGLPSDWSRTADVSDTPKWTPVGLNSLTPAKMQGFFLGMMVENSEKLIKGLEDAMKDISGLPAIVSGALSAILSDNAFGDFLKTIAAAIHDLKKQLQDNGIINAKKSQEASKEQLISTKQKQKINYEEAQKKKEVSKKERTLKQFASVMLKIVGPIIAAVTLVVSIVVTVISFGTLGPAMAALTNASIMLAIFMCTYSIVDAATNGAATAALTEGLGKALQFVTDIAAKAICFGQPIPKGLKIAIKAVIILMAVTAAIIVIVATKQFGTAATTAARLGATSAAAAAAATATGTAFVTGVTQATIQLLMAVMMSPQGIASVASDILLACVKNPSQKQKMAAQIMAMIVGMFVMIAAMAIGGAGGVKNAASSAADAVKSGVKEAARSITSGLNAVKETFSSVRSIVAAIKRGLGSVLQSIKDAINLLTDYAVNLGSAIKGAASEITGTVRELAGAIQHPMKTMKSILKDAYEVIKKIHDSPSRFLSIAEEIQKLGIKAELVSNLISGTATAVINLQLAALVKQLAGLEAASELIQGLIKLFQKMMKSIQDAMAGLPEDLQAIVRYIGAIFNSNFQIVDNLTNVGRG